MTSASQNLRACTLDGDARHPPGGEPVPADGALPDVGPDRGRRTAGSGCTCTCRSAPAGAVTATSTPTRRPNSVAGSPARGTPTGAEPSWRWPRRCFPAPRPRSTRSSSAAARRPCCRRTTWPGSSTASTGPGGWPPDAEVTTEANPESVDPAWLRRAALGRLHPDLARHAVGGRPACWRSWTGSTRPGRAVAAAEEARAAGFEHVNLDLIYGTPGERTEDFAASLDAVVGAGVDHVSAYALIVEDGTRLAARIRRGELPVRRTTTWPPTGTWPPRRRCPGPGSAWYEVSNWARPTRAPLPAQPALLDRRRLVGVRAGRAQPRRRGALVERQAPGQRTRGGSPPAPHPGTPGRSYGRDERHTEEVMLGSGWPTACRWTGWPPTGGPPPAAPWPTGCSSRWRTRPEERVLTLRGRLLADAVVRDLLP